MASTTLLVGILADLLTASFALYVAIRVRQAIIVGVPLGKTLFFWYGLAGFLLLDGGYAVLVLTTDIPAPILLLVLMARRFLMMLGIAALVSFLCQQARLPQISRWLVPYYVVLITFVEALTLFENPIGHEELIWSVQFVTERQPSAVLTFLTGLGLFLPLALVTFAVLARYSKQETRARRFRIVMLCSGIISFCTGILIGFWDNEWYWYGLFENRLAFGIAAGMLLALRPPWIVQRIWAIPDVESIDDWPE